MRIAAFLLQDMIHRNSVVKGPMAFLITPKDIKTLVLVLLKLDFYTIGERKPSHGVVTPLMCCGS
jgi:hypothetical protein